MRIAEEVTLLWQTDEVRHDRLRVADEIRHVLWFFEHSLMSAAIDLLRAMARALARRAEPLAFGTWVGGDMDGNPNSRPGVDRRGARTRSRSLALDAVSQPKSGRSRSRLPRRGRSSTSRDELEASLVRDERELPDYAAEIGARNDLEPYRRKLSFMWWRLGNDGYRHPARAARRPTRDSARALRAHGGARIADGRVARLERMVEVFGFHVAKLDVRAARARARDANARRTPSRPHDAARERHGAEALDTLIVSGTSARSDDVRRLST